MRAPRRTSSRSSGDRNEGSSASPTSDANWAAATAGSSGLITRSTNRIAKAVPGRSRTTLASRLEAERCRLDTAVSLASSQRPTRSTVSSANSPVLLVSPSTTRSPLPVASQTLLD